MIGVSLRDVELIDAASAEFERVVRQLPADSWERPTPSDVSVRELVEHVVVGNRITVAGPKGSIPAAAYLRFRLVDLVVHAWDLLRAARLDETVDPHIVVALSEVVEPYLDDMLAYGAYGAGPSGTLPADADRRIG